MMGVLQARLLAACLAPGLLYPALAQGAEPRPYTIVHTRQQRCYDGQGENSCPEEGAASYGQGPVRCQSAAIQGQRRRRRREQCGPRGHRSSGDPQ